MSNQKPASRIDLISTVAEQTGETKAATERVVNALFDAIVAEVKTGSGRVTVVGFGAWSTKISAARKARNPKTGETIDVPRKSGIRFKAAPTLTQADKA